MTYRDNPLWQEWQERYKNPGEGTSDVRHFRRLEAIEAMRVIEREMEE
jgi:hypothetical protein